MYYVLLSQPTQKQKKRQYKYIFFSRWREDGRDRAVIECVIGDIRNRRRQAHARQSLVI